MFSGVLRVEQGKLYKRKLLWIELGLMALLVVVMNLLLYLVSQSASEGGPIMAQLVAWPGGLTNSLTLASGSNLGGMLFIILVGGVTAQEYTWRTLQLWLSHGTSRLTLLAAKFTTLLPAALLVVLTPLVVGGIVTGILTVQMNGSLSLDQVNFGELLVTFLKTAYTLLPYASLTFLLAIVTRSTVAAVGGGIAYALLIEGLFVQILSFASETVAGIAKYLPGQLSSALLNEGEAFAGFGGGGNGGPGGLGNITLNLLDPLPAAIGIALYTVVFVGLAVWAFRRQDLTG